MIGHMVYFTLHDNSPAKVREWWRRARSICEAIPAKYSSPPACGPRSSSATLMSRTGTWRCTSSFATKADHDRYQDAPRHQQFIAENKANWKQVRVFDSELAG